MIITKKNQKYFKIKSIVLYIKVLPDKLGPCLFSINFKESSALTVQEVVRFQILTMFKILSDL